ncbi:AbrB family transcriptional regulator [Brevibacillus marinus]|uniref:AbrB family transcriptional regulator n=1 Tax=Brevibacillus marinus TaxID=2496837 RepID=UPI0013E0A32F|nr:AbrB family transcriptional regulator [Brevibacillus marinus]
MQIRHLCSRINQSSRNVQFVITCLIALLGGTLFWAVHSPLPWMLGPLIFLLAGVILGLDRLWVPDWFRRVGLTIVGVSLGLRITPSIWQTMLDHLAEMLLVTVISLIFGLISAWVLYKRQKIDLTTATLSSIPGGLSEVISLGQSEGGNLKVISLFHSIRVVIVVVLTPYLVMLLAHHDAVLPAAAPVKQVLGAIPTISLLLLGAAGSLLAARLSFPSPYMLGAFFVTVAISLFSRFGGEGHGLANAIVNGAQLLLGMSIGVTFKREDVRRYWKLCLSALLFSLLLFLISLLLAVLLTLTTDMGLTTSILAVAPGGLAEMSLTAIAIGSDPLLVTAFQLFRLLFIVTIFPFFVRWYVRHASGRLQRKEAG